MIANAGKANEMTSKEYKKNKFILEYTTQIVYSVYETLSATIAKSNNSVSYKFFHKHHSLPLLHFSSFQVRNLSA